MVINKTAEEEGAKIFVRKSINFLSYFQPSSKVLKLRVLLGLMALSPKYFFQKEG